MDTLNAGTDLRAFVDASPSPFHAVLESVRRLEAGGFTGLREDERWTLAPGDTRYVVRDGGSVIAFRVGTAPLPDAGVRLVGTHTDSPTFKVRPRYDVLRGAYRLVGVEPYGGLLAHTWLDRELTVAGRLATGDGVLHPVVLPGGPVRLPSLAIHLDRAVRDGLKLDPQTQLVPVWGARDSDPGLLEALAETAGVALDDVVGHDLVLADTQPAAATGSDGTWVAAPRLDNLGSCHSALLALLAAAPAAHTQLWVANDHEEVGSGSMEGARDSDPGLLEALAETAGVALDDVVGHDLVLADTQPAAATGSDGTWVAAPRLDNLGSCHSALLALLAAAPAAHTQLWVANDHEEVGSGSMEGARGSFLEDVVARLVAATGSTDPQDLHVTVARSRLVSADMAHAQHPTQGERHEPQHAPVLGGGPVLKLNANQSYATDARSGGWFTAVCRDAGVPVQQFVTRADLPCGSTIGPLTAMRLGISTVDVGSPTLAMHSCRELASAADVPLMVRALTAVFAQG
ncbi:MAG: Aspartyl aminopeptidase [Frankiales bacterium]|nr:Aspartyl aminopeptidase [Frankiales bacterium]